MPTNAERWRTHRGNTNLCPRCRLHEETIFHVLRDCAFATQIWLNLLPQGNTTFFSDSRLSWFKSQSLPRLPNDSTPSSWHHIFLNGIWQLWKARNSLVFDNKLSSAESVTLKILKDAMNTAVAFRSDPLRSQLLPRWIPPEAPFFKLNTDGAFKSSNAAGGLIRNSNGSWVKGFVKNIGSSDSFQAELWGIFEALKLALSLQIDHLIIEADSTAAITSLQQQDQENHPSWALISNCQSLMTCFSAYHIHHVLREGNKCADYLANLACDFSEGTIILDTPPAELENLLNNDASGAPSLRL